MRRIDADNSCSGLSGVPVSDGVSGSPSVDQPIERRGSGSAFSLIEPGPFSLEACGRKGLSFDRMATSFFVSRETVVPRLQPAMAPWREMFFNWMLRNAVSATDFFRIPADRVVELGTQIEI